MIEQIEQDVQKSPGPGERLQKWQGYLRKCLSNFGHDRLQKRIDLKVTDNIIKLIPLTMVTSAIAKENAKNLAKVIIDKPSRSFAEEESKAMTEWLKKEAEETPVGGEKERKIAIYEDLRQSIEKYAFFLCSLLSKEIGLTEIRNVKTIDYKTDMTEYVKNVWAKLETINSLGEKNITESDIENHIAIYGLTIKSYIETQQQRTIGHIQGIKDSINKDLSTLPGYNKHKDRIYSNTQLQNIFTEFSKAIINVHLQTFDQHITSDELLVDNLDEHYIDMVGIIVFIESKLIVWFELYFRMKAERIMSLSISNNLPDDVKIRFTQEIIQSNKSKDIVKKKKIPGELQDAINRMRKLGVTDDNIDYLEAAFYTEKPLTSWDFGGILVDTTYNDSDKERYKSILLRLGALTNKKKLFEEKVGTTILEVSDGGGNKPDPHLYNLSAETKGIIEGYIEDSSDVDATTFIEIMQNIGFIFHNENNFEEMFSDMARNDSKKGFLRNIRRHCLMPTKVPLLSIKSISGQKINLNSANRFLVVGKKIIMIGDHRLYEEYIEKIRTGTI